MRCVELNLTTKRDVISVKPYTNILKISSESRLYKELSKAIEDETDTDKLLLDDANEVLMSPVIYTEINNPHYCGTNSKNQTFKLTDLFLHYDELPDDKLDTNLFKVRFYCLRIDPQDSREIVQAMCPKCKECYSCKDLGKEGKGKCISCKVETKLVYKMQMLVKDSSSQMTKNFYRLILFSGVEESETNFFTGMPGNKPCNLY